jgi:uncharacterized protein (TIGR02757 family)
MSHQPITDPSSHLHRTLETLLERRDPRRRRDEDPVGIPWGYEREADREVAGLVTACLAYGQVDLLRDAAKRALRPLGSQPANHLRQKGVPRDAYDGFSYRMTKGPDLIDLLAAIRRGLVHFGSLEAVYADAPASVEQPSDPDDPSTQHRRRASALVRWLRGARRREELARGFTYLLPDPADGSACKRLHLFFRWMVRGPDGVDMGLWDATDPSELLMPLDTHTSRLCRYIGLTDRKSVDGKMARLVTRRLRQLDPTDPVKYDFALCHLGISEDCIHTRSEEHCPGCPIESICTLD